MWSSILLIIPFIYLPDTVFISYRYAILVLCPVSFLNHWSGHDIHTKTGKLSAHVARKLDYAVIVYLYSIGLTRSWLLSLMLVAINVKFDIRYGVSILSVTRQLLVTNHLVQMIISICLCIIGFQPDNTKKWPTYKKWIWHTGCAIQIYYGILCVN